MNAYVFAYLRINKFQMETKLNPFKNNLKIIVNAFLVLKKKFLKPAARFI